jgi:hypothetical protein
VDSANRRSRAPLCSKAISASSGTPLARSDTHCREEQAIEGGGGVGWLFDHLPVQQLVHVNVTGSIWMLENVDR